MYGLWLGKEKFITRDFYRSASELYKCSNERISICKDCMIERYEQLLGIYNGKSNLAFKHLLLNLDVYFEEELYLQCIEKDNFIGEYFRIVGSTKDRKSKTSLNNLLSEEDSNFVSFDGNSPISEDLIVEWGRGRDIQDYVMLQKRYKELLKRFPSKTPEEQYIIKDICKLELDIEECRKNGKVDKIASLENVKSKKMQQIDAIPSERKLSEKDNDIKIFGCAVRVYETCRPIPTVADKYKDVDNMNNYWENTIVKPMAKMEGFATGDYSLETGMDDIEYTPEYLETLRDMKDE